MWLWSLEEGLARLAASWDRALWSVERPRKGLEQGTDVTQIPSGHYWSGSLMENEGEEPRMPGPAGKFIVIIQDPGVVGAGGGTKGDREKLAAPHLACVSSASEPAQKSTFPKQLSCCNECQTFASFWF